MSNGLDIEVSVTLKNALKRLPQDVVERHLNTAMVSGALLIALNWKYRMQWKQPTGTYKRSVHVAGHADKTPDFKGREIPAPRDPLEVVIGTNITDPPYPVFLEYGVPGRMPPYPVAKPAMDETREDALREIATAFEGLIASEVAKG